MGEGNLAGTRPRPAADQPGVANRVMGRTEWARSQQGLFRREQAGYGIKTGDIQRLIDTEGGKDAGQGAGHESLSASRRADHENVVTPGRGNFQRTLDMLLALDFSEIGDGVLREGSVAEAATVKDRKSTRLNSSHSSISYAVFCLKKKKNTNHK